MSACSWFRAASIGRVPLIIFWMQVSACMMAPVYLRKFVSGMVDPVSGNRVMQGTNAQTGAFSPLGMYTTEEVIALGRALGLPERFLIKPPSDGLTGLTDEDNLGFTYHAVNEYIRRGVVDESIKADIDRKHAASRFKFQTLPVYQNGLPIVLEEPTDYYNPNKK